MNVTMGNEEISAGLVEAGMHVIWDGRVRKVLLTQSFGVDPVQQAIVGIILQDDEGTGQLKSLSSSHPLTRITVRIEL